MPDLSQPWIVYSLLAWMSWPFLAWALNKQTSKIGTFLIAALIFGVCLVLPWTVPASAPAVRFCILIPTFWITGRTIEIIERHARREDVFINPKRFFVWVFIIGDAVYVDDAAEQMEAKQRGKQSAARVIIKLVTIAGLLAINSTVPLTDHFWLHQLWMMFLLYTFFSGLFDLLMTPFLLAGIDVAPFFNAPLMARNLRDFWGRRWNLYFTKTCNRLIFQKLVGPEHPIIGASAVFLFSALLHEYMVWVSLERFDGRMLLFFGLHGSATITATVFGKWIGRKTLMPRIPAIMLHFIFFTVTAPLFFGPVNEIFYFNTWILW
jgi:hypothetical protein